MNLKEYIEQLDENDGKFDRFAKAIDGKMLAPLRIPVELMTDMASSTERQKALKEAVHV